MKTLALAVLALVLPAAALAQYEPAEVHVVVCLGDYVDGLAAAEFRIDNLPTDFCLIEEQWDSPLTIGTIGWGFAIAFTEVQWGPLVHLGTLRFTAWEPLGPNWAIFVAPSNSSGNCVIVDEFYEEIPVNGWEAWHVFNCTGNWCDCQQPGKNARRGPRWIDPVFQLWTTPDSEICWQDLPVFPVAAADRNWGAIKSLY